MAYSKQIQGFQKDKNLFFSNQRNLHKLTHTSTETTPAFVINDDLEDKLNTIVTDAQKQDYNYLLSNQKLLEDEFKQIFFVLKNQRKDLNNQVFWFYCYYCATQLEAFHMAYSQTGKEGLDKKTGKRVEPHEKVAEYRKLKQEIKVHLHKLNKVKEKGQTKTKDDSAEPANNAEGKSQHTPKQLDDSFSTYVYNCLLDGFKYMASIPYHTSKMIKQITMLNFYRIYWIFSRLTLTQALTVASNMNLIDKLDKLLHTHIDVSKIITRMQAPQVVMNGLSVAVFLARGLVNAGLLLKHTFFPNDAEKLAGTTRMQRVAYEFDKRHFGFMNDIAWTIANFLCNYGQITKVSAHLGLVLTSGFLVFDFFMIMYKMHQEKQIYLRKLAQYEQELNLYNHLSTEQSRKDYIVHLEQEIAKLNNQNLSEEELLRKEQYEMELELCKKPPTDAQINLHKEILNKQINELERSWKVKEATLYLYLFGGTLLVVGFTAAFIVASPVLVIAFYYTALLGMAMFLSADAYANYKDKQSLLDKAGGNNALARQEFEVARKEFLFTLVKNTVVPMVLITTMAICWPAAIVLTALYLGYEISHCYAINQAKKANERKALEPPAEEEMNEQTMVLA